MKQTKRKCLLSLLGSEEAPASLGGGAEKAANDLLHALRAQPCLLQHHTAPAHTVTGSRLLPQQVEPFALPVFALLV